MTQSNNKKLYKVIGQEVEMTQTRDQKKVQDLLKLIDLLKKQLKESEDQNRKV